MERESNSDARPLHEDYGAKGLLGPNALLGRSSRDRIKIEEYQAAPHHSNCHLISAGSARVFLAEQILLLALAEGGAL